MLTFWVRLIFMADKFSRKAWSGSARHWIRAHSGRSRCRSRTAGSALVTKHQHLSHGSGSQENEMDFHLGVRFLGLFGQKGWIPAQMCLRGMGRRPKGFGVRVKFRGWRSDEGQGYGQVRVVMRSDRPSPLRAAFKWPSPRPVRQMTWDRLHLEAHQTFLKNEFSRKERCLRRYQSNVPHISRIQSSWFRWLVFLWATITWQRSSVTTTAYFCHNVCQST